MNNAETKPTYYTEKYRPQYHFSPEENWMNDPNGMVYYEGEYHLFYQYYPHGTTWGPMHWGHAISTDLVHWEHLPIGLTPDENGMIFSGSAIVDWENTSGFFNGGTGLVAVFTSADTYPDSERPRQRQSIAYSLDKGRTWIKYAGNPVLSDENITDFRDPKVFWHHETAKWVMILAAGQSVRLYTSSDLKTWDFTSEFGAKDGSHLGVWECPDLFELPVDGNEENKKWVLLVSIGAEPHIPEGSRTQYFIGDFDGKTFTNINSAETTLWIDKGRDNYAGVSWSDIPVQDNRRIYLGWMSNWKYANVTPTREWRSSMTIPRVLSLKTLVEGIRLVQTPVEELSDLRSSSFLLSDKIVTPGENLLKELKGDTFEIIAEFELCGASEFGFKVRKAAREETLIGYNINNETLFIDRINSGDCEFHDDFSGKHEGHLTPNKNKIKLHLFVDWSSVEVFGNDGELVITDLIFPKEDGQDIELYAIGGEVIVRSLEYYELTSAWKK